MKIVYPDYDHCLLQAVNAVRKAVGISVWHPGDPDIERWLKENEFNQVIVLLIDGMGSRLIDHHLDKTGYIQSHRIKEVTTVYASTTVAATTSVLTGKAPMEHAWLGWHQYFDELKESLIMFYGKTFYSGKNMGEDFAYKRVPMIDQVDEMNAAGIKAKWIYPAFRPNGAHSIDELVDMLIKESASQEMKFIYGYWDGYDALMHRVGPDAPEAVAYLKHIETQLQKLGSHLHEKTGLLILADHGQVCVENAYFEDYPELMECFDRLPSLEGRMVSLAIKPEKEAMFTARFNELFGQSFMLMKTEDALRQNLFGKGEISPLTRDFLGTHVACAVGHLNLNTYHSDFQLVGQHAGLLEDEMMIPLILDPMPK